MENKNKGEFFLKLAELDTLFEKEGDILTQKLELFLERRFFELSNLVQKVDGLEGLISHFIETLVSKESVPIWNYHALFQDIFKFKIHLNIEFLDIPEWETVKIELKNPKINNSGFTTRDEIFKYSDPVFFSQAIRVLDNLIKINYITKGMYVIVALKEEAKNKENRMYLYFSYPQDNSAPRLGIIEASKDSQTNFWDLKGIHSGFLITNKWKSLSEH